MFSGRYEKDTEDFNLILIQLNISTVMRLVT